MKEYLHLFTRISEAKLSEYESYQIKDIRDNFFFGIYKGGEEFKVYDAIMGIWYYVTATHVLDLSALTTKQRAAECAHNIVDICLSNAEEWGEVTDELLDQQDLDIQKELDKL